MGNWVGSQIQKGCQEGAGISFSQIFTKKGHRGALVLKEADTVSFMALQHATVCKVFAHPLLYFYLSQWGEAA